MDPAGPSPTHILPEGKGKMDQDHRAIHPPLMESDRKSRNMDKGHRRTIQTNRGGIQRAMTRETVKRRIISIMKNNPGIWYSSSKIYNILKYEYGTTTKQIAYILRELEEDGILESRKGSRKGNKINYYKANRNNIYIAITIQGKQYYRDRG
uniref:Uncharacterized protein n=2 Tax=Thermoplasma acidophilum TaxID=2303 RepID=Q0KKZ1_THEAI|nr:hypothetical protein [Thermoplasma acidophilum]